MTAFPVRIPAIGLVLGAAALFAASGSEAAVLVAPVKSAPEVVQVAQGCGPGGWRGPYGHCQWGGYPHPYYGGAPGWGYGRHCWRGAYGYLHCN
jgi:hypothetical protein